MKFRLLLAVVAAPVLLSSCGNSQKAGSTPEKLSDSSSASVTVAVVHPVHEDLSSSLTLTAEFRPFQAIEVHSRVTGYVKKMDVDVGDHVRTGDVIATLEIPEIEEDLEKAQAAIATARQKAEAAEAEFAEASQISGRLASAGKEAPGLIAQQELDTAAAKSRADEASLAAAKQEVVEAQAEERRIKTLIAYSTVTAPFDAVVTRRYADTGALIQAGTAGGIGDNSSAIVSLAELDRLRLEFPVPESSSASIRVGGLVQVEVAALHTTFAARISRSAQKVDESTRTMLTEADVDNRDYKFLPGMYATARLILDDKRDVLAVPIQCVTTDQTSSVFILDREQKVEQRRIKVGLETPTMAEVLAGLSPDDLVIVGDHSSLQPGSVASGREITMANL